MSFAEVAFMGRNLVLEHQGGEMSGMGELPTDVIARACNILVAAGHGKLADRLALSLAQVETLAVAASAGTDEPCDRAITDGLWFGPQRASRLRNALAPFAIAKGISS